MLKILDRGDKEFIVMDQNTFHKLFNNNQKLLGGVTVEPFVSVKRQACIEYLKGEHGFIDGSTRIKRF